MVSLDITERALPDDAGLYVYIYICCKPVTLTDFDKIATNIKISERYRIISGLIQPQKFDDIYLLAILQISITWPTTVLIH